jgi:hypothetical protein
VGAAQQSAGADLDGTKSYSDPSGSPVMLAGKLDGGQAGGAAVVGYGLNRFLALEYLMATSEHKASSPQTTQTSDASFSTQVLGVRLTLPFGERVEVFARGGYGLYEVGYNSYAFDSTNLQTSKATFSGSGTSAGGGFELFFGKLGIEFGYTMHSISFDRVNAAGGQKLAIDPKLSASADTTDVIFSYHF